MHYLIWDADGTLVYREGMWSGTILELLHHEMPGHSCTLAEIRPWMQTGFPWHLHTQPHTHLSNADEWWKALLPLFMATFVGLGFREDAQRLAGLVRTQYLKSSRWHCFDDTIATLAQLSQAGWQHVVLSNHVPELHMILQRLQLDPWFSHIFNSAETGYEKPHPQAFQIVLDTLHLDERVWMIGDSITADIAGATAAGIPSILVRTTPQPHIRYACATLADVPAILNEKANPCCT